VRLREPPGQRQAEPGARLALPRVADLLKLLEHPGQVRRCDADAGVGDRDQDVAVLGDAADGDPASLGSELDRVRQQVLQDLPEAHRIGVRGQRRDVQLDLEPLAVHQRA
jgi:hypothetical protein